MLDPAANPYAPGAGIRPPLLAGRDRELADADRLLQRARLGYADQPRLAIGVRGVGKTVLLLTLRDWAHRDGAIAVHVQARASEGFLRALLRDLEFELRRVRSARGHIERALRLLRSMTVTVGGVSVEARPQGRRRTSGDLAVDLVELFDAVAQVATARQQAFLFTIDELQEVPDAQLSALLVALQRASSEGLPMVTVAAGLPGVHEQAAKVESFAERMFSVWSLGPLEAEAATRAVVEPARHAGGVEWVPKGAQLLVAACAGYPFYLQHFAAAVWDTAMDSPIDVAAVELGLERAERELADTLVRTRLTRLSDRERQYVEALASLGPGVHASGAVARAMGLNTRQVASARQRLIAAGMLYTPSRGEVGFTLPMFDRYVIEFATAEVMPGHGGGTPSNP